MASEAVYSSTVSKSDSEDTRLLTRSAQDDLDLSEEELSVYRIGQVRSLKRLRCVEWFFIIIATITLLGLLGFSIERLISIKGSFFNYTENEMGDSALSYPDDVLVSEAQDEIVWEMNSNSKMSSDCNDWTCLNDFTFAVLLLVNLGFCAFFCYDGILRERPFEMIGYAVGIILISLYVIVDYALEGNQGDFARLIRLVLVILFSPQNVVLAFVVQHKIGYRVLSAIGSKKSLTRIYHCRSLFLVVQRFNLQILANMLVLSWAKAGHFITTSEKVVVPLLFAIMVAVSFLGWIAVTWELMILSIVWFFAALPIGCVYVFKIINVAVGWEDYAKTYTEYYRNDNGSASRSDEAHFVINAAAILFLCVLGLVCIVVMSVLKYIMMRNYGKGLKDRLPPRCTTCTRRVQNTYFY